MKDLSYKMVVIIFKTKLTLSYKFMMKTCENIFINKRN